MFSVYADGQLIYFPIEEELTIHTPKLTLEMGKAGSFQFGLPPTNRYYDRLRQLRTIITVEYDDVEIFRGRVLTINRGFNKIRDIYCEGDLAYLVDSVQKGEKYEGTTHELFRKIIQNHNARMEASKQFVVGNIGIENREIIITGQDEDIQSEDDGNKDRRKSFDWFKQIAINGMVDEWSTTFDYIQNTIIDYCGGYLRTRHVGNTTYIDLLQDYTGTSVQKIEFGTNLIDLTEEVKAEDVYTVLIPLGDENLTISGLDDFDESRISKIGDELRDKTAILLYGRIVKTHVFDNVNKAETLLTNARRLLNSHENMPITFTVKAVDMHMVDGSAGAIYVGDRVYVNSLPHDIRQYLTCTKIEYDFDNHANDTYTFGNPKQTMTERYKKDKEKASKSGKSRGGGGGGSAGAAAAADADTALAQFEQEEGRRIDAWLNVDKETGHIDLGAFYKQSLADRQELKRSVGIDLDAPKGTVDIYAMNETMNSQGVVIASNTAKINMVANDHESLVQQTADWHRDNVNALAQITTRVNKDESQIELLATYNKNNADNLASLTMTVNKDKSEIESLTKFKNETAKSMTSIKQTADEAKAAIIIEAKYGEGRDAKIGKLELLTNDKTSELYVYVQKMIVKGDQEVEGKIKAQALEVVNAEIKKLKTDLTISGKISTSDISCSNKITTNVLDVLNGNINVSSGKIYIARKEVATQEWVNNQLKNYAKAKHQHTVNIGHTHRVTVKALNTETGTLGVYPTSYSTKTTSIPI